MNVMYIPKASAQQSQFFEAVARVASGFPPNIVSVTPTLGSDWNDEPAVFFQVVLADNAAPQAELLALTKQVSSTIVRQVQPLEAWGVLPYFNFRTVSEDARMKEPAWA